MISNKMKTENINYQMEFLFKVMDNDVTVCDKNGTIIKLGSTYGDRYKVNVKDVIGKSIFDLEKEKVFYPSVSAIVLKKKARITIAQVNKVGETILVTGVPIFDEYENIQFVVSFNSIDISNINSEKEKYETLQLIMNQYKYDIDKLKLNEPEVSGIITKSLSMQNIFKTIDNLSDVIANVIITGETGVGKTMIGKYIHNKSDRSDGPFIEINSAAIPDSLLESELFGYEAGSFTGANKKGKKGKVELADKGTLFLDEIGELPLSMQKKLLQVIQEKKIIRIGGSEYIDVDFRLITATNKDLKALVDKKEFREDLYYRLNVLPIHIPPLRERREDILPLIMYLVEKYNLEYRRNKRISQEAIDELIAFEWKGNVRELENTIERLVITTSKDIIELHNIPRNILNTPIHTNKNKTLKEMLENYEKQLIETSYKKHTSTITMAKALGIGQSSVVRKLQKYIENY